MPAGRSERELRQLQLASAAGRSISIACARASGAGSLAHLSLGAAGWWWLRRHAFDRYAPTDSPRAHLRRCSRRTPCYVRLGGRRAVWHRTGQQLRESVRVRELGPRRPRAATVWGRGRRSSGTTSVVHGCQPTTAILKKMGMLEATAGPAWAHINRGGGGGGRPRHCHASPLDCFFDWFECARVPSYFYFLGRGEPFYSNLLRVQY